MDEPVDDASNEHSIKRREALARIARFGAFTAPLVLGMMTATKAVAATTGGGGGGSGGGCCWVDSLLASGQRVGDAEEGSELLMMGADGGELHEGSVERVRFSMQPCLMFRTQSQIDLTLSESTPIPVLRNACVDFLLAADVLEGDVLPVQDSSGFRWEPLTTIESRGILPVSLLAARNGIYAAGDLPGRVIFTHNKEVLARPRPSAPNDRR